MNRTLIAAAGFVLATVTTLASADPWTTIVAPGTYGRVAVGAYDQPPATYTDQPVVATIAQAVLGALAGGQQGYGQPAYAQPAYAQPAYGQPVYAGAPQIVQTAPVYMWVPPVQRANWAQYCGQYSACNVPVYFVQDRWYQDHVMNQRYWAAQRAMTQAQIVEQDRLARERWEHARWERERAEQAHWDAAHIERERQAQQVRWEQEHGRNVQGVPAWQPGQARPAWDHGNGNGGYNNGNGGYSNSNGGNNNGNGWGRDNQH